MKSPKETTLEEKILHSLRPELFGGEPLPYKIAEKLFSDPEVAAIQNHANTVSILRLGFNDHGPVHMRTVAKNAIKMLKLLNSKNIRTSLESEGVGTFTDSLCSVIFASMLHDLGMTIGRQDHEIYSIHLALPVIDRILAELLPKDLEKRVIIKSTAMEGIAGHMGTLKIHSIEAGIILIADGCDMTKGRARIPMAISTEAKQGDIHKYSANSIESVKITQGAEDQKPIRIEIVMSSDVGYFQIEEVLLPKINSSPAKPFIELLAGIEGKELKQYL